MLLTNKNIEITVKIMLIIVVVLFLFSFVEVLTDYLVITLNVLGLSSFLISWHNLACQIRPSDNTLLIFSETE
jgi:hypothetical protein